MFKKPLTTIRFGFGNTMFRLTLGNIVMANYRQNDISLDFRKYRCGELLLEQNLVWLSEILLRRIIARTIYLRDFGDILTNYRFNEMPIHAIFR